MAGSTWRRGRGRTGAGYAARCSSTPVRRPDFDGIEEAVGEFLRESVGKVRCVRLSHVLVVQLGDGSGNDLNCTRYVEGKCRERCDFRRKRFQMGIKMITSQGFFFVIDSHFTIKLDGLPNSEMSTLIFNAGKNLMTSIGQIFSSIILNLVYRNKNNEWYYKYTTKLMSDYNSFGVF